jgi:hypothetical protein
MVNSEHNLFRGYVMLRTIRLSLLVPLMFSLLAIGCKHKANPSRVSGQVSYNANPVPGGIIRFWPAQGSAEEGGLGGFEAIIQPDGSYVLSELAEGEMIVTVENEMLNPNAAVPKDQEMRGGGGQGGRAMMDPSAMLKKSGQVPDQSGRPTGKYIPLPRKYAEKATSDLRVTLKSGKNAYNPELRD